MMKNYMFKRVVAFFLMFMMLFTSLPMNVIAEEVSVDETITDVVEESVPVAEDVILGDEPVVETFSANDASDVVVEDSVQELSISDDLTQDEIVDEEPVEEKPISDNSDEEPVEEISRAGEQVTAEVVEETVEDGVSVDTVAEPPVESEPVEDVVVDEGVPIEEVIVEEPIEEPIEEVVPEEVVEPETVVEELVLSVVRQPSFAYVGENMQAIVNIAGGLAPYVISNEGNEFVSDFDGDQIIELVASSWGDFTWRVSVTDALGNKAKVKMTFPVSSNDTNFAPELPKLNSDMNFAERLVAVALSQVGYEEMESNFIIREDGSVQGWSFYGAWYGMPYEEWCAMFVSYCLEMAGIPENAIPRCANNQRWKEKLGSKYIDNEDDYVPEIGDIVFFHHDRVSDDPNFPNHVGIVTNVKNDGIKISTVEGNTGKAVKEHSYDAEDEVIVGYVSMRSIMEKYDPNYVAEDVVEEVVEEVPEADVVIESESVEDMIEEEPVSNIVEDNVVESVENIVEDDVSESVESTVEDDVSESVESTVQEGVTESVENIVDDMAETSEIHDVFDSVEPDDNLNDDANVSDLNEVSLEAAQEDVVESEMDVVADENAVYLITTADRLNVRETADGDVIGVIEGPGARVLALDSSEIGIERWYHIQYGDMIGYCFAKYLVREEPVEDVDSVSEPVLDEGDEVVDDGSQEAENGSEELSEDLSEDLPDENTDETVGETDDVVASENIENVDTKNVDDTGDNSISCDSGVVAGLAGLKDALEDVSAGLLKAGDVDVVDGVGVENSEDVVDDENSVDADDNEDSTDNENSIDDGNSEDNYGSIDGSDNVEDVNGEDSTESESDDTNSEDKLGEASTDAEFGEAKTDTDDAEENADAESGEENADADENADAESGEENADAEEGVDADDGEDGDGLNRGLLEATEADESDSEDESEDEEPEVVYSSKTYEYVGNGVSVSVTTMPENEIPDDAQLVVSSVSLSDDRTIGYISDIASDNDVDAEAVVPYVYDIHFEYEGEERPIAGGSVSVSFVFDEALEIASNHAVLLYHVVGGSLVKVLNSIGSGSSVSSFAFDSDSFSDFIVADVDMTTYDYDNKYAILYSNGDLVFQQGNRPDETKGTVVESWTGFDNGQTHPWSGRTDVKKVIYDVDVKTVNATSYFEGMSGLTEIVGLEHLDTSTVRSFSRMFYGCSKLANNDFDKLNTDMAKTCSNMFYNCYKIRDFDFSSWTLSDATNVEYMFYNCDSLANVDLSTWSLSNVTSLAYMFYDCQNLVSAVMAGDMPKVTTVRDMFHSCPNLLVVDMNTCSFPKVSSTYEMFEGSNRLETLLCGSWGMESLQDAAWMFNGCYGLKNVNLSDWNINGNTFLSYYMFQNCSSLVELDLSSWVYSLRNSNYMFTGCSKLRMLDVGNVRFADSSNNSGFCYGCSSLEVLNLSNATTVAQSSGITSFLSGTRKLAYVDLSGFDTTAGGSTQNFFSNSGISKVTFGPNWRFSNTTTDYQLPAGSWRRVETDEVYTAEELARVWNSEMAGTYEKVASISFDPQGGSASKRRVVKYLSEPVYDGELPTATRDGYTFLGWFTDPEGGTQLQVGDVPDKIVYYAHWSENEYTLILKRNVEDDPNDTDVRYNLLYSEIFQLDPSIFENDDRVIQAWTTNADGSGTSYGADAEVAWLSGVDGGTATLYAKWGRTRFATVNFDSQGGMEISPIVIERGQQLTPLMYSLPNRADYTFMGWYDDPEGGVRWDTSNHTVTESKTLYAHWSRNPVISFNPNGGWVEYMTKQVPYGGSLGVLPNAESRPEKLIGYYTSQTPGEGTKLTASTVFTEDTTYYAHWGYQPEFKTVGGKFVGSFDLNSVYPVAYEREQTIHTLPQVTRDGYRFVKWILSDGTEVHEGDVVDIHTYPDITAVWELDNQATVIFDPDGGSMVGGGTRVWKVASGDRLGYYPYASKSINNRNAEFLGWFDENDNEYFADTVITEDVTLKAKYNSRIYTNTFVTNNSSFTRSPIYLGVNEPFGVVPGLQTVNGAPVSGQYLEGWYTSADPFEVDGVTLKEGVVKLTPETTVSEDTIWYARILDNKVDDAHEGIAYTYYAEWSNASNTYLDNSDNNLDFHPNSSSNIVANLHLHFELNGAVSGTLPVGDVRILIPKYVFKDWDDRDVGTNNLSAQIPVFPRVQSGMWFSYIDKGDHYEIVNNQPISGGAGVDLTVAYSVAPYLVPGGAVDRNGDYVPGYDFYQADIPIHFEMGGEYEVDSANGTISYTSSDVEKTTDLSLEVHTKAEPYISKSASNVYYEWQSSWGPKPADADDYFYISWSVPTYAQNSSTYYTYRVSEDTLHDGTVVANDVLNVGSQATNNYSYTNGSWYYMYPVIKYEKSLLENPPSTGVTFENQAKIELTTRAGYTIETIAKGTYTMYEWKYTKGEFDKTNTHGGVYQINGGQDKLLDDQSLDLTWELHYNGNSADTPIIWDDEAQSYHRDQRVISIADGMNSDLFLSSGEPSSKYAWEPTTGNYVLSDNDYRINKICIYTKEYDGSLINDEWGGPTLRSDYQNWKDIDVYVRHAGSNDLVFYKSVRPWATYAYGVGTTGAYGYTDVTLPADAVGYEVRYPTSYFSTYMQVYMYATVFPTTKIKSLVASDVAKNVYTEIKNRGYCNIWTSGDPYTDPDPKSVMFYPNTWTKDNHTGTNVFFHVTDWTGGFNGANKEIYELTKTNASIYVRKNASDQGNVVFDVERGFQENPMVIYGWNYASNFTAYMQRGVFYDLLPLGATVNEETIFGIPFVYNGTSASYSANNYNTEFASSSKLAKAYYSVEFIENWEGSGRTMMQISFMMPPSGKYNAVRFYYKQKMSYADVINYGTSVENDVAFVDLTDGTYVYNSESQTLVNAQFAEPDLFLPIERANDHPAYYKARSNYLPVDAFSWGFSKAVKTKDYYTDSDTTIPNNLYTYRLTFAQSDFATSDSIVFFDVFESGAYGVEDTYGVEVLTRASDWHGVFESIDVASLRTKLKANTTDIYLNPVVYYSTKDRDTFTGEDWNVANSATWSTVKPANNADITAVAVDCTKSSDGSDFIMSGRETMSIYITMRAPSDEEYIDTSAVNQARFRGNINNEPSEATSDTTVTYTEEEPEIHKSSDPETGTQDDPAVMSAGQELVYTITVKNKNQEFTVPDIVVEDDVPDELLIDKNNIKVHFGDPSTVSLLSINPRVDLTSTGNHLKFNINTLASNETCYLLIPCTAKAVGNVVIENTSEITSVNGVDKDIDSETTYHKIRYDVLFSKQSDQKRLVIGATLQLWDMDGDPEPVLVEEWVTGTSNKVIQLDPGHFMLKEIDVPSGYAIADDIEFTIELDGTIVFADDSIDTKVVMVDVESTTVKGVKHWKWDEDSDRPSSITVKLMRTIDENVDPEYAGLSLDVTAGDGWSYDFGLVPKYDEEGNEYIYSVVEEPVSGYTAHYTDDFETNGLALSFSSKTSTYNSSDYFRIYYVYRDKMFASPAYYGGVGASTNPGGSTIVIPVNDFYVVWYTDGSNNDYGFKFDQILPVVTDDSSPFGSRNNMPDWTNGISVEEYSGSRYPETDHEYFVYEKMVMHYSRESEGNVLDIVNSKNTPRYDVPIDKISEDGDKIGGVVLRVTSVGGVGEAQIDPIEWTTVADQSNILQLYPGHYLLHEVSCVSGYQFAEDIEFMVDGDGEIIVDSEVLDRVSMVDKYAVNKYPFRKVWMDAGFENLRPSSLTFNLVRVSDDEVVATKVLTSSDAVDDSTWSGWFDDVSIVDEDWNPIEYVVREVGVSSLYRAYHDVQNKVGFYVTFTEDSDIGSGKLYIYPGGWYVSGNQPHNYMGAGTLVLNPTYNMEYAEGTDMAGKTYFVPIIDGVEAFVIARTWASDSVNLEIESIVPAFESQSYEIVGSGGPSFTNVFSGKNYPNLNSDGVSVATYQWVSQLDTEGDIVLTDEIANYVNRTNVPFAKYWDNEFDDTSDRPPELTFDLYNVLDMDTPVATKTVSVANGSSAEYVFEEVPKYNDDWSLAKYVIRERSVEGYRSFVSPDEIKGFLVTFSDDSTAGSGSMYLYSKNADYVNGPAPFIDYRSGSNYSSVSGSNMAGKTYYVPVFDSVHPGFVLYVGSDSSKTANLNVVSVVPVSYLKSTSSVANGMPLQYANAFFSGSNYPYIHLSNTGNFTSWYSVYDYDTSVLDVHNVKDETRLPVTKIWADSDDSNRPESITINAYNVLNPDVVVGSVVLSSDDSDSENQWSGVITGLPRYNNDGSLCEYVLKEEPVDGYFASYTKPVGMLVTFSEDSFAGSNGSTDYITLYTVSKNLRYRLNYIWWPDLGYTSSSLYGNAVFGKTLYVPIVEDGCYAFGIYKSNPNSVVKIESVQLTTQAQTYSYSSTNSFIGSSEYWYRGTGLFDLTGRSGYMYYDYTGVVGQNGNGGASVNNVITNEIDIVDVPFVKQWIDYGYENDRPSEVTFGLYNERDMETVVSEITVNRDDVEEGNVWNCEFVGVPKFNDDGTLAVYVVRELDSMGDYTSYDSISGIKGFLLKFSDDTDLTNGGMYIWQSNGYQGINYVRPSSTGTGSYYWYGTQITPAGKTVYVPVAVPGVYEFVIEIYRNSSSYTNVYYNIEEIIPVYEDLPYSLYTGVTCTRNLDYNYYELVEDVSSLSRDFSRFGTSTNYLYTWVRWNIDDSMSHGLINRKNVHFVRFNKSSLSYENVSGALLQVLKKDDMSVMAEWESNVYDYELGLAPGEYILHEVEPPVGFALAEDVEFIVGSDGSVTVDGTSVDRVQMIDDELVDVRGTKAWVGDNETQRPSSITVNLYQNGELIDSVETTADEDWQYEFIGLTKYDENGEAYEYTVNENPVYDYAEVDLDTSVTGSWLDTEPEWEMPNVDVDHIVDTRETSVQAYEMILSSNSYSESASYDYFYIYFRKNGQLYMINSGQGSSNGGRFGGSLYNKKIVIPSNDIYIVWRTDGSWRYYGWKVVAMNPLAVIPSDVGLSYSSVSSLPTVDGSYSFGVPIEYSGNNYPETEHNYNNGDGYGYGYANNERKIYHWTGPATALLGRDDYTVSASKGLKVTFDKYSQTEATYDKLEIYFYAAGQWFKLPQVLTGDLRGAEFVVPSRSFYLKWTTNGSVTRNGWKIASIVDYDNVELEGLIPATDLPNISPVTYTGEHYPSRQNYGNNETRLYQYVADALVLPDEEDRYSSYVTANIVNTRQPDKLDYSVYKQDPDGNDVAGAVLEITGHEEYATYDIVPIQWTTSGDGPEVVQLRQGQYVLHEVSVPTGYLKAADVPFMIDASGAVIIGGEQAEAIYMTDVPNKQSIPVSKVWDDVGLSQYRPSSITFDLYDVNDMDTVVDTLVLTADDDWSGAFEDVPLVYEDDDETEIVYTVVERDVRYYDSEIVDDYSNFGFYSGVDDARFVYTPHYGMQINFSSSASQNGVFNVVFKDRMTGAWYVVLSASFGSNTVLKVPSNEVYLFYNASSASSIGIDINSINPVNGGLAYSYQEGLYAYSASTSFEDVVSDMLTRSGRTNYYSDFEGLSSFVDGSNGYHNPVSSLNMTQYVKLTLPAPVSVVESLSDFADLSDVVGFKVTMGDDIVKSEQRGPFIIIYKDDAGVYHGGHYTVDANGVLYIKSSEFYIGYRDANYKYYNSSSVTNVGFPSLNIRSVEPVRSESGSWISLGSFSSATTYEDVLSSIGGSYFTPYELLDGRLGTYNIDCSDKALIYSFDYTSAMPSFTKLSYFADNGEFVASPVVAKNTFVVRQFSVPFAKRDENGDLLGGAHLKLFDSSGSLVSEWDTSSSSMHSETLDYGAYVLKETSLPAGYVKASDIAFILTPIGEILVGSTEVTAVNMVDNDTLVRVEKHDEDGDCIAGSSLIVYSDDINDPYDSWTSTTEAHVIRNIPEGTYTLHEVAPPSGYLPSDDVVFVVSSADGTVKVNDVAVTSVVMNDATLHVPVRKLGVSGDLAGATVSISGTEDLSDVVITSNDVIITDLDSSDTKLKFVTTGHPIDLAFMPAGTYILHEDVTVDGYTYAEDIEFSVAVDGTITIDDEEVDSVDMQNTQTVVRIRKVDINDDLLAGATLQILDEDGEIVVDNWVSTDDIKTITGVLRVGQVYVLHEVSAPVEYNVANDISFSLDADGNIVVNDEVVEFVTMVDTDVHSFTVLKRVTGLNGNKQQSFNFAVTLKDADDHYVWNANMILADGSVADVQAVSGAGNVPQFKFALVDGQSVTFNGLYDGYTWVVTEDDYSDIKYETSVAIDTEADDGTVTEGEYTSGLSATGSIFGEYVTAKFDNHREYYVTLPSTGYRLYLKDLYIALGLSMLVLFGVIIKKKREQKSEG